MRVALSLERELTDVVGTGSSNDAHWYSIMGSSPLRLAFEGAFNLPSSSFGSIDVEQQLSILKARSESFFGTSEIADLLDSEKLDQLRQAYLLSTETESSEASSSADIASLILSSF